MLYIVATPIGNLDDITLRALRVLSDAQLILAEDTRRTRNLCSHHQIDLQNKKLVSCHEHNERERTGLVLSALQAQQSVALVTDAGTPGVSDPGYLIVKHAWDAGYQVVPIPGACAATAALSAGGLPTDRFTFAGFPPKKTEKRRRWLDELATAPGTLVLYAAARDVEMILKDLVTSRGDPQVVVFREMTKKFEECLRGTASELAEQWAEQPRKGEVTILCDRPPDRDFDDASLLALLRDATVKDVAWDTGVSKRRLYQLSLLLRDGG